MLKPTLDDIVIVGGGTAGWLTAAILAKKLNAGCAGSVTVTVIESPDIPIIGVGEGTWPTMRTTLQTVGVDEGEFMRECDATFKQGAEFVNWQHTPAPGESHSYFHPLSAVFHSSYDFNLAPYWLQGASELPYDLAVASQSRICQLGLAPKKITTAAYTALQNYAYHFNAVKFAAFMKKHCIEKLSVRFIAANVQHVRCDVSGGVAAVQTDNYGEIAADFFVDCTGSKALLLGEALGVGWHSINDVILNDTALAVQVPYPASDWPIATHTIATAHEAGWTWDIGLHNRRGVGYVYSSAHSSDERAEQILRSHIGGQADELDVRKIKLNLGYRQQFWRHNCVAIGMSAAFVEPLEASAIFLVEAAANMLADQFPRSRAALEYVEKKFNDTFRLRWDKSIDFIKLHYCISRRRDSDYWIDNCSDKSIPLSLQQRLAHWQLHPPGKYDFDYAFEPFVLDSYLFVLYGMKFNTDIRHNLSSYADIARARKLFAEIDRTTAMLQQQLPSHRELIDKVYQYGMPVL